MNDLEWLARNVHEWPKNGTYAVVNKSGGPEILWDCGTEYGESFSDRQWQAERARLQNKPKWEEFPQAKIRVQNGNGIWCVGTYELARVEDQQWSGNGEGYWITLTHTSKHRGEVLGDWRDTLEPRPEEQTMTKKEWRGPEDGLPPVGTKCEVRTGYATEPYSYEECDIIAHFMGTSKMCAAYTTVNHDGSVMVGQGTIIAFRPLRTEEDKAVEDMYRDATGDELCGDEMDDQDIVSLCQVLFKAGYRKQDASE